MIISASYKTDIPAFYGRWFMNRLAAGFCRMINPYNRQVLNVSLRREETDGFVFWTKNLGPFLPHLQTLRELGYPFVIQYTITGYPRELEYAVVPWERSCEHAEEAVSLGGPRAVVWRYDPILLTSLTPVNFHLEQFERLCDRLKGITDEVVVSFAQLYRKTIANLARIEREEGVRWWDPPNEEKRDLVSRLACLAWARGIQLTVCAQAVYAKAEGARPSRCIDAERLSVVAGERVCAKVKGNRPDCECHQSRDIGDYDTCPHGCVYCYSVHNWELAKERHRIHDPDGEFLFKPDDLRDEDLPPPPGRRPLSLFE